MATLLIIGLSSSLSIGSEVLCTQLFVHRWRSRTKEDLQYNYVTQQYSNNPHQAPFVGHTLHWKLYTIPTTISVIISYVLRYWQKGVTYFPPGKLTDEERWRFSTVTHQDEVQAERGQLTKSGSSGKKLLNQSTRCAHYTLQILSPYLMFSGTGRRHPMKASDTLSLEVDEERWCPLNDGLYIVYTYCFDLQYQLRQCWENCCIRQYAMDYHK